MIPVSTTQAFWTQLFDALPAMAHQNRNKKSASSVASRPAATGSRAPIAISHSFSVDALMAAPEASPMQSFVDRLSADGRRVYRENVPITPISPLKRARLGKVAGATAPATVSAIPASTGDEAECYPMDDPEFDNNVAFDPQPPKRDPQRFKPSVRFFYKKNTRCIQIDKLRTRPWTVGCGCGATYT